MAETTITLADQDESLRVLGTRDQNLRMIREALGVKIMARDAELRIEGADPQVAFAARVFEQLRHMGKEKPIAATDVQMILDVVQRGGDRTGPDHIPLGEGARSVRPRTDGQARYVRAMKENDVVLCVGPAGTGKTYLAVAMAVNALRSAQIKKIVLCRPAVEAGERLGYLPGDIAAKVNPYLRPLLDALNDMMEVEQVKRYMENDLIEICPLAYMRGRTLNNAAIILDEGQNTTVPQMKMFLTRMGIGSKIVVTGDITQVDLPPHARSGLTDAVHRLRDLERISVIYLNEKDIVRHALVQKIVRAYDEENNKRKNAK